MNPSIPPLAMAHVVITLFSTPSGNKGQAQRILGPGKSLPINITTVKCMEIYIAKLSIVINVKCDNFYMHKILCLFKLQMTPAM